MNIETIGKKLNEQNKDVLVLSFRENTATKQDLKLYFGKLKPFIYMNNIDIDKFKYLLYVIRKFKKVYIIGDVNFSQKEYLEVVTESLPDLIRLGKVKQYYIRWKVKRYIDLITDYDKTKDLTKNLDTKWHEYSYEDIEVINSILSNMVEDKLYDEISFWLTLVYEHFYLHNDECPKCGNWKLMTSIKCRKCTNHKKKKFFKKCVCGTEHNNIEDDCSSCLRKKDLVTVKYNKFKHIELTGQYCDLDINSEYKCVHCKMKNVKWEKEK